MRVLGMKTVKKMYLKPQVTLRLLVPLDQIGCIIQ